MSNNKMISSFISAIVVLGIILIVVSITRVNYDPRGLDLKSVNSIVINKHIKPAGTTPMYRAVGSQIHAIPVTNQEEPTVYVMLEDKKVAGVLDKEEYNAIAIGDSVKVQFLQPKFWGKPIIVKIEK